MQKQFEWLNQLNETLPQFVSSVRSSETPGKFYLCKSGLTPDGEKISLGFSTYAMRIYYMLGLLDSIPPDEMQHWVAYLQAFQIDGQFRRSGTLSSDAFVDLPLLNVLLEDEKHPRPIPWKKRIRRLLHPPKKQIPNSTLTILADTRQSVITLELLGAKPLHPYTGFVKEESALTGYLAGFDWTKPWGAGAQAAVMSVLITTQAPDVLGSVQTQKLRSTIQSFLDGVVNPQTGGYYLGDTPQYDQFVNGSHKVVTALHWLDAPVHYPEKLTDAILARLPSPEGCHMVDAVYPLYRCMQQNRDYRKDDLRAYCTQLLEMISRHYNPDGGLSYYAGRTQTSYYGATVADGQPVSDLHGSLLLLWALSMLVDILEINQWGWKAFKP